MEDSVIGEGQLLAHRVALVCWVLVICSDLDDGLQAVCIGWVAGLHTAFFSILATLCSLACRQVDTNGLANVLDCSESELQTALPAVCQCTPLEAPVCPAEASLCNSNTHGLRARSSCVMTLCLVTMQIGRHTGASSTHTDDRTTPAHTHIPHLKGQAPRQHGHH